MLTRDDIYVGNIIEFIPGGTRWQIERVHSVPGAGFKVALTGVDTGHSVPSYSGSFAHWRSSGKHRIKVNSLDYVDSEQLDDEDKQIIKEYLDGHH